MKNLLAILLFLAASGMSFAQNGLNFDGSNDYVQTSYQGIIGSANRTFEAWVNVSATAPASNLTILDYGTNAAGSRNTFVVAGDRSLGFLSGGTNANMFSTPGDVPVGQWVHVAFILDNGTGFLFVDGIQVATGNLSNVNTPFGNLSVRIGERVPGGSIPFHGSIDEVRIWNQARTTAQINDFKDVEFCTNPSGLTAYYKMNEGVAGGNNSAITMTVDEVSSNNGILNGFALTGATSNFVTGASLSTSTSSTQTVSGCEGFTVTVGGNVYDSTGIYVDTLASTMTGCDSVVTTDLTVTGTVTTTQTLHECAGFSVSVDTNTYNSTGIYVDTLSSIVTGCDSVVTTDLTIDTLDITTSVSGPTITATQSGVNYSWIDCDNNNAVIPGATSQSFSPTQNGNYAVIVDNGICTDTSACVSVTVVGIEAGIANEVKLYPNPTKEQISIQWAGRDQFSIVIFNSLGKELLRSNSAGPARQLEIAHLPTGVYFVELEADGVVFRSKFVKL